VDVVRGDYAFEYLFILSGDVGYTLVLIEWLYNCSFKRSRYISGPIDIARFEETKPV